ncbi:MAG: hypothetical protein RLZZ196_877 [Bacteroidota bacterium]|jgi:hypothetical protein
MRLRHKIQPLNSTAINLVVREATDAINSMSIQNVSNSGFAYLGASGVTSSDYGIKLFPGQIYTIELAPSDDIWAVGDSGVSVAIFNIDRS